MRQTLLLLSWTWIAVALGFVEEKRAKSVTNTTQPAKEAVVDPADQKLFAWFDTLGFPDLAQRKFRRPIIEIVSGRQDSFPALQPGFLLHDDEKTFTLFTIDFDTVTYKKNIPANGRIKARTTRFETIDLAQHVSALLKKLNEEMDEHGPRDRFYRKSSGRAEALLLARACQANDRVDLAHQLIQTAAAMRPDGGGHPAGAGGLQVELASDIGHTVMWLNVVALGQPEVGRPELLKRFRSFSKTFPGSKHVERATKEAKILEKMVLEDAEHEKQTKPFDQLTVQERVTELIYQLREQNGQQNSQPGACDIFADPRDNGAWEWGQEPEVLPHTGSPAVQLVMMRYDAVPQLIEHLGDVTLTRSITYHRDFHFSHHALTVGECCRAILIRISGRRIPYNDARRQAEQWWTEFQKKGEKQTLIDGTIAGDDSSSQQAERLLKKYPDAALESIIQGAKNAKASHVRVSLGHLSTRTKGEKSDDFFLSELKSGPSLEARAFAGKVLAKRNHPDVLAAMIREWQQLKEDQPTLAMGLRSHDGSETIIHMLARSNNVEAVRALGKDLDSRPIARRMEVILALKTFRKPPFDGESTTPAAEVEVSEAVSNAVEELLAHSLEDAAQLEGLSGSWGKTSFRDPRVCEFAAYVLATLWPKEYVFDLEAPQTHRRRQLLTAKNVWRAKHELPAIPIPEVIRIDRLPMDRTEPLIAKIIGTSDNERDQAIQQITALGLPALPAVMDALQTLPETHPARTHLRDLSSRLGSVVGEIELEEGSIAPDTALKKRIAELRNRSLSRTAMIEFVKTAAGSLPKGADKLMFLAERIDDRRGIHLTIALVASPQPRRGNSGRWKWTERVELNEEPLCGVTGGISREYGDDERPHKTFYKCVDQALAAPADARLLIEIKVTVDR